MAASNLVWMAILVPAYVVGVVGIVVLLSVQRQRHRQRIPQLAYSVERFRPLHPALEPASGAAD
jgi:hypothetical protein